MLNSTKCPCGQELKNKKFDKYVPRKFDDRFYGGRVSMEGTIRCECGRELKGYFETSYRESCKYDLIDLEVIKDITPTEKIDLKPTSCEGTEVNVEEAPNNIYTTSELTLDGEEDSYIAKTYEEMDYNELRRIAKGKASRRIKKEKS